MATDRNNSPDYDGDTLPDRVALRDCFRDSSYARLLDERRVQKMVDTWDEQLSTQLLLSLRDDGRYAIIDGNHHAEAARRLFGDDCLMAAHVYIDLTIEDEARLYARLNVSQKRLTRLDVFKADVAYGDDAAVTLKTLIESCGFTVAIDGARGLQAIAVLERMYTAVGIPMLADALLLLHKAWGDDPNNIRGEAIEGMVLFLARYRGAIRGKGQLDRLINVLREHGPAGMVEQMIKMRAAYDGTAPGIAWGRGLHAFYNKGLRDRLDEWVEKRQLPAAARVYEPLIWRAPTTDGS